jgi:hypothetical protein
VAGEAKGQSQAIQSWYASNEGDIIDALRFQAAPGAGDTLLTYYW